MTPAYTLRDADEGACRCGRPYRLLTHKTLPDGYPAFLICFPCEDVTPVGGADGEVVEYKRGRRKKHTAGPKREKPAAKAVRRREYEAEKREARRKPPGAA